MATMTADQVRPRARQASISPTKWGVFVLRFVLGVIFFMHGGQKVFGWFGGPGLADSVAGMGHMGLIAPLAYISIYTEFVGGILLIIGFLTRIAALGILIDMVVAVAMVHFKNGFFMQGGNGLGYEYNLALIGMSFALFLTGPGALAIGDLEKWILKRS